MPKRRRRGSYEQENQSDRRVWQEKIRLHRGSEEKPEGTERTYEISLLSGFSLLLSYSLNIQAFSLIFSFNRSISKELIL